jgi:hypothetical protein
MTTGWPLPPGRPDKGLELSAAFALTDTEATMSRDRKVAKNILNFFMRERLQELSKKLNPATLHFFGLRNSQ